MRTLVVLLILSILLFCLPRSVTDSSDVKASVGNPVHNLDTGINYTSIQDAINANETLTGHTIFVENGTYLEHVSVNKSISLIGESRQSTVVDASHVGHVFDVTSENVSISNFRVQNAGNTSLTDCAVVANKSAHCTVSNLTIQNCYSGILILESNGSSVSDTVILGTLFGMYIHNSSSSVVVRNDLTGCAGGGISIQVSTKCFVRDNNMTNCYTAFAAGGDLLEHFLNDIDTSNTIDGKPIYYLMNQTDITINPSTFPEIGSLTVVNSTRVTIENLTFNKGGPYLFSAFSSNSTIRNVTASNSTSGIGLISVTDTVVTENNVSDCFFSIYLTQSHNNTLMNNTISNSGLAAIALRYSTENLVFGNNATNDERCIDLMESENNTIRHNNFVNYSEAYTDGHPNVWDDGLEGNYWSSYAGVDLNNDGIGDTPHTLDVGNEDNHPLMGMFHAYIVSSYTQPNLIVNLVSNSSVSSLEVFFVLEHPEITSIQFYVSGESGLGFCRICIPHNLINAPYQIYIDEAQPLYANHSIHDNGTHTWIYFTYEHTEQHSVIITIPEFSKFTVLLMVLIVPLIAVAYNRKKRFKK